MTCLSVYLTWFLLTLGPQPVVVARFADEATCRQAQAALTHAYTLTGEAYTRW
jgi:hypothetical protein